MVNHVHFVAASTDSLITACEQALHGVKKLGRRETVPFS